MNRQVKLITLDLDNTLWDVDRIIIQAEADMVAWLRTHVPQSLAHYQKDVLNEIRQQVFAKHADKSHDLSFMRVQLLFEVMQRAGLKTAQARKMAQQAFDVFYEGRNRVVLFPGAQNMLQELSQRYDLYALTNGNANIHKAGLTEYFQGAFSSADVGNKKPHPQMFLTPLKQLSAKPHEAIHIGDHLIDDIQGADAVGMHSIWVNLQNTQRTIEHPQPTREVKTLHDVMDAVEDIVNSP